MTPQAAASRVLPETQFPPKQSPSRWLLAAALLLALACGGGQTTATPATPTTTDARDAGDAGDTGRQVRGNILEVVARNITEIERMSILDQDGRRWTFTTEGYTGVTPSHLREHQLFGQQVVVSYVERKDRLVAVKIGD